jgi:hypothetical protein
METISQRLLHRVEVVHGGTGRPYGHVRARLVEPVWTYWRLRRRGSNVLLSTEAAFEPEEPATTTLEVEVTESDMLERFQNGGVAQIQLSRGTDEERTLTLPVENVVLEVTLVRANGTPRTGRTVQARSGALAVGLPAVNPTSNVYRSAPTSWDPALQPWGIFVNGTKQASASLDYTRPVTRLTAIDP